MKKRTDVEDRIRQVAWPALPEGLRARVLSVAPVQIRSIAWSDRVWFSRRWRLSMAAATVAMLTVQVLSGPSGTATLAATPQTLAQAEAAEAIVETTRQIGLPAELAASLVRRSRTTMRPRAIGTDAWQSFQAGEQEGARR